MTLRLGEQASLVRITPATQKQHHILVRYAVVPDLRKSDNCL